MFIVKAEVRQDVGPQTYQLYEAPAVRVGRPEMVVQSSNDPELSVSLCDLDGQRFKSLDVGHGIGHYSAVYIMNEKGKTIDSVYPGPAPLPVSLRGPTCAGVAYATGTNG